MRLEEYLDFIETNEYFVIKDKRFKDMEIIITKRHYRDEKNFFSVKQIHSDKIFFIDEIESLNTKYIEADAIVSNVRASIGVLTADCLPVFIYSDDLNVLSVVHAGWRGTAKRILQKTVELIKNNLQIELKELNFILGVCICNKCYEIGNDMYSEFIEKFGEDGKKFFSNKKFDLKGANIYLLESLGIDSKKIFKLNKCTICNNKEFFSFRKEKTLKRTFNFFKFI